MFLHYTKIIEFFKKRFSIIDSSINFVLILARTHFRAFCKLFVKLVKVNTQEMLFESSYPKKNTRENYSNNKNKSKILRYYVNCHIPLVQK